MTAGPMKVVHVVLSLNVGGSERNVINQVREGRALGQEVSIICLEEPGVLAGKAESMGARVYCLHKTAGLIVGVFGKLRSILREIRPHIVHSHQLGTMFYCAWSMVLFRGMYLVHTQHGRVPHIERRRTRWLGRLGGIRVERFFCLTEDIAAQIVSTGIVPKSKIRLIMNGIDTAMYDGNEDGSEIRRSLQIPEAAKVFGTVGRLAVVKNQKMLLYAFAAARRTVPDSHLIIVGDGPLREELLTLSSDLGISDVTHFVGYQPEVWRYLGAMNCFVLSSVSEGMPQSVLEACVAGLPVLTTRVGGLPEFIEHEQTGLLVDSDDVEAFEKGLLRLANDSILAEKISLAARTRVLSMYDIRRMAGDYHREFLGLVGHSAA